MEEQDSQELGTEQNPLVVKPEKPFEKPAIMVSWIAPSRVFKNRQPTWFIGVLVLCAMAVLLLILTKQWILMLAIIAFVFSLIALEVVEPEGREYSVTTYGIKVGKKHYKYYDLKWFWFEKDAQDTVLYISTFLNLPHVLEIPLPHGNIPVIQLKIEDELLKHIPFHEEGERNYLNSFDNVVSYIEPWIPKSLIDLYMRFFNEKQTV